MGGVPPYSWRLGRWCPAIPHQICLRPTQQKTAACGLTYVRFVGLHLAWNKNNPRTATGYVWNDGINPSLMTAVNLCLRHYIRHAKRRCWAQNVMWCLAPPRSAVEIAHYAVSYPTWPFAYTADAHCRGCRHLIFSHHDEYSVGSFWLDVWRMNRSKTKQLLANIVTKWQKKLSYSFKWQPAVDRRRVPWEPWYATSNCKLHAIFSGEVTCICLPSTLVITVLYA
jgi:hypothetical protein